MQNVKITCLIDNAVLPSSAFWGEHGLAFAVQTEDGQVLFDTGSSGEVLSHNLEAAEIYPASISALALSHSHPDHTGGLSWFTDRRPGLPLYAHPELLGERFSRRGGQVKARGLAMSPEALRRQADLRLSSNPQEILPGVWTTGEVSERPEPEGRSAHHVVRQGDGWAPDPYRDDMALVLDRPKELVLLCGCCHAGLLNTLLHVRRVFGRDPAVVIGGMHLVSANATLLLHLVARLRPLEPLALYPNHCTGLAGYVALACALGDRVAPCPAGTVLEL